MLKIYEHNGLTPSLHHIDHTPVILSLASKLQQLQLARVNYVLIQNKVNLSVCLRQLYHTSGYFEGFKFSQFMKLRRFHGFNYCSIASLITCKLNTLYIKDLGTHNISTEIRIPRKPKTIQYAICGFLAISKSCNKYCVYVHIKMLMICALTIQLPFDIILIMISNLYQQILCHVMSHFAVLLRVQLQLASISVIQNYNLMSQS